MKFEKSIGFTSYRTKLSEVNELLLNVKNREEAEAITEKYRKIIKFDKTTATYLPSVNMPKLYYYLCDERGLLLWDDGNVISLVNDGNYFFNFKDYENAIKTGNHIPNLNKALNLDFNKNLRIEDHYEPLITNSLENDNSGNCWHDRKITALGDITIVQSYNNGNIVHRVWYDRNIWPFKKNILCEYVSYSSDINVRYEEADWNVFYDGWSGIGTAPSQTYSPGWWPLYFYNGSSTKNSSYDFYLAWPGGDYIINQESLAISLSHSYDINFNDLYFEATHTGMAGAWVVVEDP